MGGFGGYLGGRLALGGEEVALIARGEHLRAIREHGLKVDSIKGDFQVRPALVSDDPAEVGVVDAIILGVKAWQVIEAAEAIRPMVGRDTFVVPLQNGVEAPSQLAEVLGAQHVVGGLGQIISFIVEPGHIRHAGAEPLVRIGELDNRPSPRIERLRQALVGAGVTIEVPPNIQAALWTQLLLIAPWSGVGAVTRAPAGVWRSGPETRRMVEQVMHEVVAVAGALDIALPGDVIDTALSLIDRLPPDATASMQRDIIEGRPSELEYQNGSVVRLGGEAGVPTPVNEFIYHSLLPQEMAARGQPST